MGKRTYCVLVLVFILCVIYISLGRKRGGLERDSGERGCLHENPLKENPCLFSGQCHLLRSAANKYMLC